VNPVYPAEITTSGVPHGGEGAVEVMLCRRRDGRVDTPGAGCTGGTGPAFRGLRAITGAAEGFGRSRQVIQLRTPGEI
jgi:hypothetical protein